MLPDTGSEFDCSPPAFHAFIVTCNHYLYGSLVVDAPVHPALADAGRPLWALYEAVPQRRPSACRTSVRQVVSGDRIRGVSCHQKLSRQYSDHT